MSRLFSVLFYGKSHLLVSRSRLAGVCTFMCSTHDTLGSSNSPAGLPG
jgi:hypothetical protein